LPFEEQEPEDEDRRLALYQAEVARRAKLNELPPDEPPPLLLATTTSQTAWYGSGPETPLALRLSETSPTDPVVQGRFKLDAVVGQAQIENSGPSSSAAPPGRGVAETITLRIETDHTYLLWLAISLEKMARDEVDRLSSANDPDTIEHNKKQIDLLSILADGFAKIVAALQEYSIDPQPLLAGRVKGLVDWVGAQINAWWAANAAEARDWGVRIPTIGLSIAALGLAGADMHFATPVVSALVGGPKVISTAKALLTHRR
jgi:hypothetical protein